jgi:hypothetical protein
MWIAALGKWYLVPLQDWPGWFERYNSEIERWFEPGRTVADWICILAALLAPVLLKLLPRFGMSGSKEQVASGNEGVAGVEW